MSSITAKGVGNDGLGNAASGGNVSISAISGGGAGISLTGSTLDVSGADITSGVAGNAGNVTLITTAGTASLLGPGTVIAKGGNATTGTGGMGGVA